MRPGEAPLHDGYKPPFHELALTLALLAMPGSKDLTMPYLLFILIYIGEPSVLAFLGERTYGEAQADAFIHAFLIGLAALLASEVAGFIRDHFDMTGYNREP